MGAHASAEHHGGNLRPDVGWGVEAGGDGRLKDSSEDSELWFVASG